MLDAALGVRKTDFGPPAVAVLEAWLHTAPTRRLRPMRQVEHDGAGIKSPSPEQHFS